MNQSFSIQGYSGSNQFLCVVDGEDIYQADYMGGNRQLIGKTISAYKELEQTTTDYYNKLVELGVITPPQDPQKVMEQMQKTMLEMSGIIKSLSEEVKELKQNGNQHNPGGSIEDVSEHGRGKRGTEGTGSDKGNA